MEQRIAWRKIGKSRSCVSPGLLNAWGIVKKKNEDIGDEWRHGKNDRSKVITKAWIRITKAWLWQRHGNQGAMVTNKGWCWQRRHGGCRHRDKAKEALGRRKREKRWKHGMEVVAKAWVPWWTHFDFWKALWKPFPPHFFWNFWWLLFSNKATALGIPIVKAAEENKSS